VKNFYPIERASCFGGFVDLRLQRFPCLRPWKLANSFFARPSNRKPDRLVRSPPGIGGRDAAEKQKTTDRLICFPRPADQISNMRHELVHLAGKNRLGVIDGRDRAAVTATVARPGMRTQFCDRAFFAQDSYGLSTKECANAGP